MAISAAFDTSPVEQRNPYLDNIDAHLADPSVPLHPNSAEAIKRSGVTLGVQPPPQQAASIASPATQPVKSPWDEKTPLGGDAMLAGTGIQTPRPAPAMPLAEGGVRGNAANKFNTSLAPGEEAQYQTWKSQYAPKDSGEDYDLQGAYKYGLTPDPQTGHWSDRFKKPNEPTFSNESQYAQDAPEKAGHWNGDTYVPPKPQIASAHPAAPAIQPVPRSEQEEAQIAGLNRITAPDTGEHNKFNVGTSGINQIHSPWARIPLQIAEAIGTGFAPALTSAIPGTQLHHNVLVNQAEGGINQQEKLRKEQEEAETAAATQGHLEAESENQRAMATRERQAPHPTITTDKGIMQWNPQTGRFDIPAGNAPVKEEMEGKTITTDQGIMQWNPATKSYDIKAGDAPEKEGADKTLQDTDGLWYRVGKNNEAVPITINGQPFKGKGPANAGDDFSQFYQKWLKEKGLPDNASNEKKARTEWSASGQTPERPPVVLIPGPNNTVVPTQARLGVPLSNDFQTVSGAGGANAKAATTQANIKSAMDYASNYLKGGNFTGAGDEALMEQYFELAKPTSGFRMSQPQIDMLMKGRSWMGSAEGLAYHAKTGTWFPPQQRSEIVATMANLGAAKGFKSEGGGGPTVGTVENGYRFKGGDPKQKSNWEKATP